MRYITFSSSSPWQRLTDAGAWQHAGMTDARRMGKEPGLIGTNATRLGTDSDIEPIGASVPDLPGRYHR